jgi:hypothetical protein
MMTSSGPGIKSAFSGASYNSLQRAAIPMSDFGQACIEFGQIPALWAASQTQ